MKLQETPDIIHLGPQAGPQSMLLSCPANEIFYGGARGGGKSAGVCLKWLSHEARWRGLANGIIFRRSYPALEQMQATCEKFFRPMGAKYIITKRTWVFPSGAWIKLRHLDSERDCQFYQGHEWNFLALDEIGSWPMPTAIDMLKACLRSSTGVKCIMLCTGNPGGVGHNWNKDRYIDHAKPFEIVQDPDLPGWTKVYIPARVSDNQILMASDPYYKARLKQTGPDWLVKAWLDGDWEITPSAYFMGVWDKKIHEIEPFDIPIEWKRWRACDWGFAKPYSIGWYTKDPESECIYRYREMYGWGGAANKGSREEAAAVARRIHEVEEWEVGKGCKFLNNPGDSAMWAEDGRYKSVNDIFLENGIVWSKSHMQTRSRVAGLHVLLDVLRSRKFKVFKTCKHFIRTVPSIPSDPLKMEDVDTDAEDHACDEFRYSIGSHHTVRKPEEREDVAPDSFDWVTKEGKIPPQDSEQWM